MRGGKLLASLLVALLVAEPVGAVLRAADDPALVERLQPLIFAHQGDVAVAVKHLPSGRTYAYRSHEPMSTASLIKLPVMVETYRQAEAGKVDLDKRLTLQSEDKAPGSGILTTHFAPGMSLTLRDAVRLMIAFSDNTATNLVLSEIGIPATGEYMTELGLPNTRIHAKVFRADTSIAKDRSKRWGLGSTTAAEMLELLERLSRKELVSPQACDEMLGHLFQCDDKARFPRFLPPGTKVAHKTGAVAAIRTDAGLIESPGGTIALCVLTSNNTDQRWVDDTAGNRLCAEIAREVYDVFNPKTLADKDTARGELKLGDAGELVMALQRTLNAQLNPSPDLTVDGDFGPATETAVVRFQRSRNLEATGQVAAITWQALGPLLTTETPVADPEKINSELLETKPADTLDGPPFTTARAWVVADGTTGNVLWGSHEDQALEMASTTKLMTAWVTLKLAEKDAALLDSVVTVSAAVARTGGSSASLREGDRFVIKDLLYGLLLPSGNDAAAALAEALGEKCEAASKGQTATERFVTEMNRQAQALEMKETRFMNPHGLPAKGHVASARDLAKLAFEVTRLPLIQKIVTTRQLGTRITNAAGQQRNVVWKNLNELLKISGYTGIKTGTTRPAGACLVSSAERGDRRLIVVVLGCPTSDCRYVDTRNLYRWAWGELEKRK